MSTVLQTVGEETSLPGKRFSVEEYHRMIAGGVFAEDERYELLDGVITPKMAKNPRHDGTIGLLSELLRPLLPAGCTLRIQSAITTLDSEPEPDIAIVRGAPASWLERHPRAEDIVLVVEVADTSLGRDRVHKGRIYARAGIATYWIVNLRERRLEVHEDPSGPGPEPCYRRRVDFREDEEIVLNWAGPVAARLRLADVFCAGG
jgi:Uma2 family endonuclease